MTDQVFKPDEDLSNADWPKRTRDEILSREQLGLPAAPNDEEDDDPRPGEDRDD